MGGAIAIFFKGFFVGFKIFFSFFFPAYFSNSPRQGCVVFLVFVPRGSGSAVFLLPLDGARPLFKYCSARANSLLSFRARHSSPTPVIPSEAEESRGNEYFLIPRDNVFTVV